MGHTEEIIDEEEEFFDGNLLRRKGFGDISDQ